MAGGKKCRPRLRPFTQPTPPRGAAEFRGSATLTTSRGIN